MSIGFRKLEELINEEISEISVLSKEQEAVLASLCKKLYMIESNQESISTQRLIEQMKGEISLVADSLDIKDD